ncbi:MAG TPA: flavodoxin family protein [Clostridiales bacterium]|nr:flavodoxin family protein [Clostridiales bacterium]
MKVLLINGSPRPAGCTYTALREVADALEAEGIETEFFQIGTDPVRGCIECWKCSKLGRCVFDDDICNEMAERMIAADGIVIGSPVFYAAPAGQLCALLDRVFYAQAPALAYKPAAAIVNCRRGGASAAFDRLNKYFTINHMPVVSSQYWNSVHGRKPEEVLQDREGMQTMRLVGKNMAWLLKNIEAGGVPVPEKEPWQMTDFCRKA